MTPLVLTWQAWRQARLDNALIVALRHHDDASAVTLLNQGASARQSIPLEDVTPSNVWEILRSRFSGKSSPQPDGASCLMWALGITAYRLPAGISREPPTENPRLIAALLAHGADANEQREEDITPLTLALDWNYQKVAMLLLQNHAAPNVRDAGGRTPLMLAVWGPKWDNRQVLETLFKQGADLNSQDDVGETALMLAADHGNATAVQFLLDHHANIHLQNSQGWTALHYAGDMEDHRPYTQIQKMLRFAGLKE